MLAAYVAMCAAADADVVVAAVTATVASNEVLKPAAMPDLNRRTPIGTPRLVGPTTRRHMTGVRIDHSPRFFEQRSPDI
jgi:hypothetical protein